MIDHVYITVDDLNKSTDLYQRLLETLGWRSLGLYQAGIQGIPDLHGFADSSYGTGKRVGSSIWLRRRDAGESGFYLGLVADSPDEVDAAFQAALTAGATAGTPPGLRPHFGPGYYSANVIDFDSNEIEIVNKAWNPNQNIPAG